MELTLTGLTFFNRHGATPGQKQAGVRVESETTKDKRLFCALCRHPITHQDERMPVNGRHEHTCTNPGGYTFRISCFHEAAGCIGIGEATRAHTWFDGYAWQVATCARCDQHLGWRFQVAADYFHGLILDRLTSIAGASK